jgi:hypothetical protein
MFRRLLVTFVLLTSWAAAAQPAKRFEIVLVFTDRAMALYRHIDNPDGTPVNLETAKIVPRGKLHAAVVLFRNCKPDEKGLCNIELDTLAYTPAGKLYGYRADPQFWLRKPEPSPAHLQAGRRTLALTIDPGDPAGTWRVSATARDRIANVEASAEVRFEVAPE